MKTAVFSDSHGNAEAMLKVIRSYCPDQVIHLGDGRTDLAAIEREFPLLPVCSVSGNCDYDYPEIKSKEIRLGTHKAFLTHGHCYGVRFSGLSPLLYAAECSECDIAMYGHTHEAYKAECGGILVLNPGSIGKGANRSWAKLETDENGNIFCEIVAVD